VVGTQSQQIKGSMTLALRIHARCPDLPVIAVGRCLDVSVPTGLAAVFNLPRRAAELRVLAGRMAQQYLSV
jgi:hypothetical protein